MLYVGPCEDDVSKLKVLKALTRKFHLADDLEMEAFVKYLPKAVTGAQIYSVCSMAWLCAVKELIENGDVQSGTKVVVKKHHFDSALVTTANEISNSY